jgi:predicted ArsR family transcriptional regulator
MDSAREPHKIAKSLSRKPHRILISIYNRGGSTKTSNITSDTGLGSPLANYHLKNLMEAELVERTGEKEYESVPREGYTYQLTDKGTATLKAAQEDYDLDPIEESEVRRRFDDLEARTEGLEQQNRKLVETVEELTEENERLEERIDDMRDANSKLWEDVQELRSSVRCE